MAKRPKLLLESSLMEGAAFSIIAVDNFGDFNRALKDREMLARKRAKPGYVTLDINVALPKSKRTIVLIHADGRVEALDRQPDTRQQIAVFVPRAENALPAGFTTVAFNSRIFKPKAVWWGGCARLNGSAVNEVATQLFKDALVRNGLVCEDSSINNVLGTIAIELASSSVRDRTSL